VQNAQPTPICEEQGEFGSQAVQRVPLLKLEDSYAVQLLGLKDMLSTQQGERWYTLIGHPITVRSLNGA